ncbi:MAG: hypothetical protein R2712_11095 [Vicinamibacterales bacterium]
MDEEVVLACLLHDVVLNLVKVDHGWWGAQMIEPYVPERTSWAIRYHQALRFYPTSANGYEYPERTTDLRQGLRAAAVHQGRALLRAQAQALHRRPDGHGQRPHAFGPNAKVSLDPFIDITATSSSRRKGWATTTARWRTCGAR